MKAPNWNVFQNLTYSYSMCSLCIVLRFPFRRSVIINNCLFFYSLHFHFHFLSIRTVTKITINQWNSEIIKTILHSSLPVSKFIHIHPFHYASLVLYKCPVMQILGNFYHTSKLSVHSSERFKTYKHRLP